MSTPDWRSHYQALERRWHVEDRISDYSKLVTASTNSGEQIHSWFNLKEAYSNQLLPRLLKDSGEPQKSRLSILDPFCGSGTTLLSGIEICRDENLPFEFTGIERNPFITTLAQAKVAAAIRGSELSRQVRDCLPEIRARYTRRRSATFKTPSSTLNNAKYFNPSFVSQLLRLSDAIDPVEDVDARSLLQVALASCIEPSGRLRRDGRALRFVEGRDPISPRLSFWARVDQMLSDLDDITPTTDGTASIIPGDAREVSTLTNPEQFNWVICSPPYPNNIDYTEVYKLENWVLRNWSNPGEMKAARHETLRSHPSVRFEDTYSYLQHSAREEVDALLDPILSSVPQDRYSRGRRRLIRGYTDDMLRVFEGARRAITKGGRMIYVVGNSCHGHGDTAFVIAADLILARLAELAGWDVEEIRVARQLHRRGTELDFMRESVVSLRPSR